jgi:hypothetical protein
MAELLINASANKAYGSVEITNKYAPLTDIKLAKDDREKALKIVTKRMSVLSGVGAFPRKLSLYREKLPLILRAPPVAVISSNRAEWIADQFAAEADYEASGYLDGQTFTKGLYLWYSPRRTNRRVFIIVHYTEYHYYFAKLGHVPLVTIVGFRVIGADKYTMDVVGFGASRFAALELVKLLGFNKAWVVDDNVVNINGFPNTLAEMEANMDEGIWGISFKAATLLTPFAELSETMTFAEKKYEFSATGSGLLQQAVLWNVDRLWTSGATMSPCFLMSNEDVSFCNWMKQTNKEHRVIKTLEVVKVLASPDKNNHGAREVEKRRSRMLALFHHYETELNVWYVSDDKPPKPPKEVPLRDFVRDVVLPKSPTKNENPLVTLSRCAEQVMSKALENWPAPDGLFNPYREFKNADDRVEELVPNLL